MSVEDSGSATDSLCKVKAFTEKPSLDVARKFVESGDFLWITSWQIDEETVETVADFIFFWLQNHCR